LSLLSFSLSCPSSHKMFTLSLHDALPILPFPVKIPPLVELLQWHKAHSRNAAHLWFRAEIKQAAASMEFASAAEKKRAFQPRPRDRKSTRLNSSHVEISYAVFCLKKKKKP